MNSSPTVSKWSSLKKNIVRRRYALIGYLDEERENKVTGKMEPVSYSPYYEFEKSSDDGLLFIRLVITLGPERIPDSYTFSSKEIKKYQQDDLIHWVSELYFINNSDSTALIKPMRLSIGDKEVEFKGVYEIEPGTWKLTPSLISIDLIHKTTADFKYVYHYQDKDCCVEGKAKRLTTQEVAAKYG